MNFVNGVETARKIVVSVGAIFALGFVVARAPYILSAIEESPAAERMGLTESRAPVTPRGLSTLSVGSADFTLEERPVEPCQGALERFYAEQNCGHCLRTTTGSAGAMALGWLEPVLAPGESGQGMRLHSARVECAPDGKTGLLSHLETAASDPSTLMQGLTGGTVRAATTGSGPEPPLLAGAKRVLRLEDNGWRLFIDEPARLGGVLEQMEIELLAEGWRPIARSNDLDAMLDPNTRVFAREGAFCIVSRKGEVEGGQLVTLLREDGWNL